MSKEQTQNKNWLQLVLIVLLVAAALAIGSMWTELKMLKGKAGSQPTQQAQAPDEAAPEEKTVLSDEEWQEILKSPAFSMGDDSAKVAMVEFSDYQCPFCKRHFDQTWTQIKTDYIDSGKMFYVLRDLPLSFHQNADEAAAAARCVGDQGKYREYHDKLFENQTVWAELDDPAKTFKGYAAQLALDQTVFNQCYDTGKYKQAVTDDLALAQKVGASGTPTFFINGKVLVGAQPFSQFQAMIEAALGE